MRKKYGFEVPFMCPVRLDLPGGRLDRHYEVVRVQNAKDMVTYKVMDRGKNGRANKEVASMGYAILPDHLVLGSVFTHKKYRRLGLQEMLIRIAEQDAITLGKKKIRLDSYKKAIPFYEKIGFKNVHGKNYDFADMSKKTRKDIKWPKIKTFEERKALRRNKKVF
ncbi:MAG: GNAT family N-acetyltransferase [archaeon]